MSKLLLLAVVASLAVPTVRLTDLNNRLTDPFDVPADVKAIVFIFTSVECPISNRYAPVLARLHSAFAAKGVRFWLIYPNPGDTLEAIRGHVKAYGYPMAALRDPDHALANLAHATVTPEAAVYDRGGRELYRGRIDDRYVSLGLERPQPRKNDLSDALSAVLAGKTPAEPTTPAVGCFIADFVR